MGNQIEVILNGQKIKTDADQTILEFAESQGIDIPTLCHDPRLEPYGSCFVCVVEVVGARTLVPACATKLREGIEVNTNTDKVMSSRKTALELILSNHEGDCIGPCKTECPANCDAQGYVGLVANKKYDDAIKLIKDTIPMPAAIGRVCPAFCEDSCRRGKVDEPISIRNVKRYAADLDLAKEKPYMPELKPKTGKKVAIVGGGPAGLAASYYLTQEGVDCEIFEAQNTLGGMTHFGIPQYRLPKDLLAKEISTIIDLGVKVNYNQTLGKDFNIDDLRKKGFDAIFLAFGAWKAYSLGLPGEDSEGIIDGIKFLEKIAKKEEVKISGKVAVVGGGNTAFDCARTALRAGADKVTMIYRRTLAEMPANEVEKIEAKEEGITFTLLTNPVKVVENNKRLTGLVLKKMELGEPDASGRRRPVPVEGSDYEENFDFVITAVGQGPDMGVLGNYEENLSDGRKLNFDKNTGVTPLEFVFGGGDCAIGATTVVEAFGSARKSVNSLLKYLKGEKITYKKEFVSTRREINKEFLDKWEKAPRQHPTVLSPEVRRKSWDEVESMFEEKDVIEEAKRCMECGCMDVYGCKLKQYSEEYDATEEAYNGEQTVYEPDNKNSFLYRDPSKCILCGRCVRLCDQKIGLGIYGYVDRGFATTVSPKFGINLDDSDCIECGLCISGCPVGAITPKTSDLKQVPLKGERVDSTCYHCSLGCETTLDLLTDSVYEINEQGDKYLCKKGRFKKPSYIPDETADYSILKKFKDAIVYPTPSLSSEDYESLKLASSSMNWSIANYYSQGSLYQAFSKEGKMPSMNFKNADLTNALVVIAGNIAKTNPVIINGLSDKKTATTKIVTLNKELDARLKRFNVELIDSIEKVDAKGYREVYLIINPIDVDEQFGFGTSLAVYNGLARSTAKLNTTLLSEGRNLYSIYDAANIAEEKDKAIYIGTVGNEKADDKEVLSIQLYEKEKLVASLPFAQAFQNNGSFLTSRNINYKNTAFFNDKVKTVNEILNELFGFGAIGIKDINSIDQELELNHEVVNTNFVDDSFIVRNSRK